MWILISVHVDAGSLLDVFKLFNFLVPLRARCDAEDQLWTAAL